MYCKEIRKKGIVLSLTQGKKNPWQGETHSIDFLCVCVCKAVCACCMCVMMLSVHVGVDFM